MRRVLISSIVLLVVLIATRTVFSAPQSHKRGSLNGVVLGPDDKPVAHATVSYQSSAGFAPHAVRTDSKGHFLISKLRADNYDLRASKKGEFSEWQKNVNVRSGQEKDITLRLSQVSKASASPNTPRN
jgi:hypothetical protein